MFELASALHKTVSEVMTITADEFNGWLAFSKLKQERKHHGG